MSPVCHKRGVLAAQTLAEAVQGLVARSAADLAPCRFCGHPDRMHLASLWVYPVKSLRGCAVAAAAVDALGLAGDRRFLVVDGQGRFLTQRTLPHLALIETALDPARLTLSVPGHAPLHVRRQPDPAAPVRTVSIWSSEGLQAEDCGTEATTWLSAYLGVEAHLVRIGAQFDRPMRKPGRSRPEDRVAFVDAYPFLALGEATLAALNDRLIARGEAAVPMDRFRPNLIIAGAPPHAEDGWQRFRVGGLVFRSGGDCVRCIVPTTDQATGERGPEPLRTLADYRRDPADANRITFGQNLIHETKHGQLRVGDTIEVIA